MEHVATFLVIFSMNFAIQSFPIENGFSVKFNPMSAKEVLRPRKFGSLFAKIPQEFKGQEETRRAVLTKAYFPMKPEVPSGYSNQVAKLLFRTRHSYFNKSNNSTSLYDTKPVNFLSLPIARQPYDNYRVLVASAPPNLEMGREGDRTIIYVVFPEDRASITGPHTMSTLPIIYFVNEKGAKRKPPKKGPEDPILIIDSNRTVTGLKSKEVSKFVKFKNKLSSRHNYWLPGS